MAEGRGWKWEEKEGGRIGTGGRGREEGEEGEEKREGKEMGKERRK